VRKGRRWLFFAAGAAIGAAAMIWANGRRERSAVRGPQSSLDSLLNIPPEQTVLARQEFLAAYKAGDRRHARALYEEFLPRIGANGLRETIQGAYPQCHDEGHDLGKVIFTRLRDVGGALESCADACASGCMHGVLMQFFTDTGGAPSTGGHQHSAQLTVEDVAERIPTICESPAFTSRYSPGDCAHGVGHAVMFLSRYDIPAGIELCERFSTYPLRYYCATGAYMEYRITRSSSDYPVHGGLYPCDKALYPAACFRYVMTNTIREHYSRGGTLETLQRQCAGLKEKHRLGCFHGLGNAHVTLVARRQKTLADVCGSGSRSDQTACVEGAMERLGKFSPTVAADRCTSLTDWRRAVCDSAAARKMYDMEKSFALYQR
jgi:hypothetical protein